jgi:H+/Cl- antiporter ClcA
MDEGEVHGISNPRTGVTKAAGAVLRRELYDWRLWGARAIVVGAAILAGMTIVGFTWLTEHATNAFFVHIHSHAALPLIWTPLCSGLIVWCTRRFAAGAAGSGIPQVMAALDTQVDASRRGLFVSLRLSLAKIVLTSWGLLGGLSLGREGPSVQIAAGIMLQAQRWMPRRAAVNAHGLLVAGGAAGIAAAFNTPLAGVMFAIEELARAPEKRNSGLIIAAIVLAGLIAVSAHGNGTYFGVIRAAPVGLALLLPGLCVTIVAGLAGGVFSRLILASLSGEGTDWLSRLRGRRPVVFAMACGVVVAVIGLLTGGATFGTGYASTRHMVESGVAVPATYAFFKFLATWFTTWAGVPAGIFAPSLAIGAGIGNDIALLAGHSQASALIALGMVGFLAAVTQAPLTSFIIVMEMVDGHAMVLSLMACALVGSAIARLISRPLYPSLARLQLMRM